MDCEKLRAKSVILSRGDDEGSHSEVKDLFVYMMTNESRVVLYTGVTNNLERRVWEHQHEELEGFTKKYCVNRLVYFEVYPNPRDAITREKEIKGWRRSKKNALVESLNPRWRDLGAELFDRPGGPSLRSG